MVNKITYSQISRQEGREIKSYSSLLSLFLLFCLLVFSFSPKGRETIGDSLATVAVSSVFSPLRRLLRLLSSSPSEERWKPTTLDDSLASDGVSSVFSHLRRLRNNGNSPRSTTLLLRMASFPSSLVSARSLPSLFQMSLTISSTSRSTTQVINFLTSSFFVFCSMRVLIDLVSNVQRWILFYLVIRKSKKDFSIGYCGEEEVSQETCRRWSHQWW